MSRCKRSGTDSMHHIFIFILQIVASERFRSWLTQFIAGTASCVLEDHQKRGKKARKKRKRKKEKNVNQQELEHAQGITAALKARVENSEHALLEKAGVFAELSIEEGGLNRAEGSFCGMTPEKWNEYRESHPEVQIEKPADFLELSPEVAAAHIYDFMDWYFNSHGKGEFWVLPPMLWFVVCNSMYLAPYRPICYLQQMIGFTGKDVDGIWGSGMSARVHSFFQNKTVPHIKAFAKEFTDLMSARYDEISETNPEKKELCEHWKERTLRVYEKFAAYLSQNQEVTPVETSDAPAQEVFAETPASVNSEYYVFFQLTETPGEAKALVLSERPTPDDLPAEWNLIDENGQMRAIRSAVGDSESVRALIADMLKDHDAKLMLVEGVEGVLEAWQPPPPPPPVQEPTQTPVETSDAQPTTEDPPQDPINVGMGNIANKVGQLEYEVGQMAAILREQHAIFVEVVKLLPGLQAVQAPPTKTEAETESPEDGLMDKIPNVGDAAGNAGEQAKNAASRLEDLL